MSDALYYTPPVKPSRAFRKGDKVLILSREHTVIGEHVVTRAGPMIVRTDCGRRWDQRGWWCDEEMAYPFPSIVHKSQFERAKRKR